MKHTGEEGEQAAGGATRPTTGIVEWQCSGDGGSGANGKVFTQSLEVWIISEQLKVRFGGPQIYLGLMCSWVKWPRIWNFLDSFFPSQSVIITRTGCGNRKGRSLNGLESLSPTRRYVQVKNYCNKQPIKLLFTVSEGIKKTGKKQSG